MSTQDVEPPAVGDLFARRRPRGNGRAAIPWPAASQQTSTEPPHTPEYRALMDSGDWHYQLAGPKQLRIWTKPGLNWYSEQVAHAILTGKTPDRSKPCEPSNAQKPVPGLEAS